VSYNIRDRFGHWVAPPSRINGVCPHACCRNRRAHPRSLPVVLDKQYLRSLNETDLTAELDQYIHYTDKRAKAFGQITAEFDRRDRAERAAARRKDRQRERSQEHYDEVYRQYLAAEAATNGYLLNRAGLAAGINERSLFTGPEARVRKYASPELLDYFSTHGRPTRVSFLGSSRERRVSGARSRLSTSY
jgi:hypothetical protein